MRLIRSTVSHVLATSGWRGGSSAELSRLLGVDRSLGWKVWSLAEGEGIIPSPQHVPGRGGVEKFLLAASRVGAPPDLVDRAREAFAAYRRLAVEHGSDRASADIMLGTLSPEGAERQDLALRRALFRGNSRVLGTQAGMLYQCSAVFPGASGDFPSVAIVRGYYGLRTMRPGVWWVLSRSTLVQEGGPVRTPRRHALCGGPIAADASPLLDEFCRPRGVKVRRRQVQGATVQDELEPRPMGRAGEVDVVLGEVVTGIPRDAGEVDAVTMAVRVPAEAMCFDILLHEGVFEGEPSSQCMTLVNTEFPFHDPQCRDVLPFRESLTAMGRGGEAPAIPEVPDHATLLERIAAATGHPPERFRAYRLRMRFPPVPICWAVSYVVRRSGG